MKRKGKIKREKKDLSFARFTEILTKVTTADRRVEFRVRSISEEPCFSIEAEDASFRDSDSSTSRERAISLPFG